MSLHSEWTPRFLEHYYFATKLALYHSKRSLMMFSSLTKSTYNQEDRSKKIYKYNPMYECFVKLVTPPSLFAAKEIKS